jgi:hypothetical protein
MIILNKFLAVVEKITYFYLLPILGVYTKITFMLKPRKIY